MTVSSALKNDAFNHPIFRKYRRSEEHETDVYYVNMFGAKIKKEWERHAHEEPNFQTFRQLASGFSALRNKDPSFPPSGADDYYEWIDILEALERADDRFTMIEAGAGYGRWSINAALAAQHLIERKPPEVHITAIETDCRHIEWIKEHARINGVANDQLELLHKGVADKFQTALFPLVSANEYGQAIIEPDFALSEYLKQKDMKFIEDTTSGSRYQVVDIVPFQTVIEDATKNDNLVDIVDMDIQGAEKTAIPSSIGAMNERVKRLHLATHSRDIEAIVYDTLIQNGWRIVRYYPCFSRAAAEFGPYNAGDGLMSALNTRF